MDTFKARLTRTRLSVALSYAALQAPLDDDTFVTQTEVHRAVSEVLEAAANDLHVLLLVPDVVLTLPAPTDDDLYGDAHAPSFDPVTRGADELREELLMRELCARCTPPAGGQAKPAKAQKGRGR